MEKHLKDKTVVITGAASGFGYEITNSFLSKSAKVVIILDINENLGKTAVKYFNEIYGVNKAVFYKCDVTKDLEKVYNKIVDTFKKVDVLVNNAGTVEEIDVKKTVDINVTALIQWSLKFFEHMRKDKSGCGGTIINLSSIYGFRCDQYLPVYKASKFAVMGFTKTLGHSENFNKFGVRVVAICPGLTKSDLAARIKPGFPEHVEDFNIHAERLPWQDADKVGKAAVDVFETANSGTAWLIEGGNPISQVH